MKEQLIIIGGGLAGTEAAWQAAQSGIKVLLYEMRPQKSTPAHVTNYLAELVCSNSLGSTLPYKAPGLLKSELKGLGSIILSCAETAAVPAGTSLAVDREIFGKSVTERIINHPNINLICEEVQAVPGETCIIASGPLTSSKLAEDIGQMTGQDQLYFYDALSPIVNFDSIDMSIAFRGSRHKHDSSELGDYVNCPMTKDEYDDFFDALISAEQIALRNFEIEDGQFFEGCLPVEVLAQRGRDALRYGPLRPVGLVDPNSDKKPYAVVQLRQDNLTGTLYNLVGFQTNMRWGEQRRVLRKVPGLHNAEFMRYGMMHRNTYINSPRLLHPTMQYRSRADLFFAGQIVGAEGYVGNAATGLIAGLNAARLLQGKFPIIFPTQTMLGALCHYVTHAESKSFQPMKANFGLLPSPEHRLKKTDRYRYYYERALTKMRRFAREQAIDFDEEAAHQANQVLAEA